MYSVLRRILIPVLSCLAAALVTFSLTLFFPFSESTAYADSEQTMTVEKYAGSKYENEQFKSFYGVKSGEISSYTNNGGEREKDGTRFTLANAFDGDTNGSTFWMSETPNSQTFKNHIIVNFTKTLALKSIRYKSSYYSSDNYTKRNFSGYPTTLSVYVADGDDNFTLAGVCVSTPQKDFSEDVVFSLVHTVKCSKLKFEFTEVSVYSNVFSGDAHIAAAMDISFYKSDEGVVSPVKGAGKHADVSYLSLNSVSADEMKIRANGGGTVSNAFDKNTATYYQSESYNTDLFTNKITLIFEREYTFSSIVYGCSFYTRDNGRNYSGYPLMFDIEATDKNGAETKYTFGGVPGADWNYVDFSFPEPVTCKQIELIFSELTTFSEVADNMPVVACSEIFLVKTTNAATEEMLAEINGIFTDYAQYELNENCTAEYLKELRASAKDNSGYESTLKPVLDRAEAILSGAIRKDPYREFSTDPKAKNVIEQYGALASYCRNTLQMTSYGTDRQVIGIGGTTGETITIYVEAEENDPLPSVAFTQIYGSWQSWIKTYNLQRGKNEIVFDDFKAGTGYSVAVTAGGPIHVINPYTSEQQSPNVKLYFEGGYVYPVFHDGDDEGTFKIILKDYYERLTDKNDTSITVDAFEAVTDNAILSCTATLAYNSYIKKGTSPQYNVDKWRRYTRNTLIFGGVEFDPSKPYYDVRNNRIKVNYRTVQPYAGFFAFAATEHVGLPDSSLHSAMVQYWTLGWAFYHEMGHQLDNRRMMIGEVTNNMWAIYNLYMVEGTIADRINVSAVSRNLASDFSNKVGNYWNNGNSNCDFWWILEGASPGYWGRLQRLYCFDFKVTADDIAIGDNEIERLCYYSSLAVGEDVSAYFERFGFYFKSTAANKFTVAGASQAFKTAMANAKAAGKIKDTNKKYWYVNNGQYRAMLAHGGTLDASWGSCYKTSQKISPLKIMGTNGSYTLLLPDPAKPDAHLCYEIQGYIDGVWKVLGVTDGTSYSDTRNYGSDIPQYRVYAYDRFFNHTGDPTAVSPKTDTQTNVCRIGDTYYNSLKEAVKAANSAGGSGAVTIYLVKDFEDGGIETRRESGGIYILPDPEIFKNGKAVTITKNASGHLINMIWPAVLGSADGNNVPTSSPIILDGGSFSQSGSLVHVQSGKNPRVSLNNVTMQNNLNSGNGGGLLIENGSYINVNGCTIKNNRAANGGGIAAYSVSDIQIRGLTLKDNVATGNGGGMYISGGNYNVIFNHIGNNNYPAVTISGNRAANGGGIYAERTLELYNAQITNNTATQNGGGVYTAVNDASKYVKLTNCTIKGNTAVVGDALYMHSGTTRLAGGKVSGGIYKNYGASVVAKFGLVNSLCDLTETTITLSKSIPQGGLVLCDEVTGISADVISEPAKNYKVKDGRAEFVSGTGVVAYPIPVTVTIKFGSESAVTEMYRGDYTLPDRFEQLPEGKYIEKYTVNGKDYAVGAKINITGNFTATAIVKDYCKVTLIYGTYAADPIILKQNVVYYLPMKTPEGEVVFGWDCSDGNYYAYAEGVEIVRDTVFNAVIKQLHTVITQIEGVETVAQYEYGGAVTLSSPPAIFGKVFSHWEIDGKKYSPNQTIKVTGDITAKAVYSSTWEVTTVIEDDEQTQTYANGAEITLGKQEASFGRQFKYWLINGVKYYAGSKYTVTADCEIVAVFAQVNTATGLTVTLSVNKGPVYNDDGTVNTNVIVENVNTPVACSFNSTYTFTAPTGINAGNEFLYWEVNGVKYYAGSTITVTENITAVATVVKKTTTEESGTFTVTVKDEGSSPATSTYKYAANSTIYLAQPTGKPQGKAFAYWLVGGERKEAGEIITVTQNVAIEAKYDSVYTVTVSQLIGGKQDTVEYEYGNKRVFTLAAPKNDSKGKIFSHWLVNGTEEKKAGDSFEVTSDTTVVAVYDDVTQKTVTTKQYKDGKLSETSEQIYVGDTVKLDAPQNVPSGKVFVCWDVNGVEYSAGSKLIVLEDTQIVAVYKDATAPSSDNTGLVVGIVVVVIALLGCGAAVAVVIILKKKKALKNNND